MVPTPAPTEIVSGKLMTRSLRANIRNFLMTATKAELQADLDRAVERGDEFRAQVVRELLAEQE